VNRRDVQAWLDAYVAAWRSYDRAAIGDLFTEDATYAYHPWDDPLVGRDAIVASWLEDPDEPDSWRADCRPLLAQGNRAIVTGVTHYARGAVYDNLWVMRFDADGRCADFVEWYMKRPRRRGRTASP
jgi:ketosteroid isomerase-like protein